MNAILLTIVSLLSYNFLLSPVLVKSFELSRYGTKHDVSGSKFTHHYHCQTIHFCATQTKAPNANANLLTATS